MRARVVVGDGGGTEARRLAVLQHLSAVGLSLFNQKHLKKSTDGRLAVLYPDLCGTVLEFILARALKYGPSGRRQR